MSYIYNDEDDAPMNAESIGYPYPVRTLEEMITAWEEQHEKSEDCVPSAG